MRILSSVLVAGALVCLILAVPSAQARSDRLDGAIITNGGSTNSPGFSIRLHSDGSANFSMGARMVTSIASTGHVPQEIAQRFFKDLKAARAANAAQSRACMKSASFGSTTLLSWHGWNSGDLECPGADAALQADVASIKTALGIDTSPGADRP